MKILVTGGAGLVGSECIRLLLENGHEVISVDNYMRGVLFGEEGDTRNVMRQVLSEESQVRHVECDIRDKEKMVPLVQEVDGIIHAASQPSHPRSIEIPLEDFSINAEGTLNLLEWVREHNPGTPFVFCSTNKVYGDYPNQYPFKELPKRFDFKDVDGIDELCPVDQSKHTPFGVSKLAADLYVQEYARLYGLKTGVFRMGCITGSAAMAVEQHNWEPYFVKKCISGEPLTIFGFSGKQVRDVIHARDLARLFLLFLENPKPGEVYNIGGGRGNSISLLEAIDLIESLCEKKMVYSFGEEREGDHRVYISDLSKVKAHYPWDIEIGLQEIFEEIHSALIPTT